METLGSIPIIKPNIYTHQYSKRRPIYTHQNGNLLLTIGPKVVLFGVHI